MLPKNYIVMKLGGSAITCKDKFEIVDTTRVERASFIVRQCYECKIAGKRIVLVHGAGSFGHQHAKKYGVHLGFGKHEEDVKKGFCETRHSVMKLNSHVLNKMLEARLPVVAISPCGTWRTDNRHVIRSGTRDIIELADSGFIPLLHGDCVLDDTLGCTILSGDTIIETLCEEVPVSEVIFLTDVDGIYDKPPSKSDAKRLDHISVATDGELQFPLELGHVSNDVTGGIQLKLQTAVNIVCSTKGLTTVFVCNISSDVALRVCLNGIDTANGEGTVIKFKT